MELRFKGESEKGEGNMQNYCGGMRHLRSEFESGIRPLGNGDQQVESYGPAVITLDDEDHDSFQLPEVMRTPSHPPPPPPPVLDFQGGYSQGQREGEQMQVPLQVFQDVVMEPPTFSVINNDTNIFGPAQPPSLQLSGVRPISTIEKDLERTFSTVDQISALASQHRECNDELCQTRLHLVPHLRYLSEDLHDLLKAKARENETLKDRLATAFTAPAAGSSVPTVSIPTVKRDNQEEMMTLRELTRELRLMRAREDSTAKVVQGLRDTIENQMSGMQKAVDAERQTRARELAMQQGRFDEEIIRLWTKIGRWEGMKFQEDIDALNERMRVLEGKVETWKKKKDNTEEAIRHLKEESGSLKRDFATFKSMNAAKVGETSSGITHPQPSGNTLKHENKDESALQGLREEMGNLRGKVDDMMTLMNGRATGCQNCAIRNRVGESNDASATSRVDVEEIEIEDRRQSALQRTTSATNAHGERSEESANCTSSHSPRVIPFAELGKYENSVKAIKRRERLLRKKKNRPKKSKFDNLAPRENVPYELRSVFDPNFLQCMN